MKAEKKVLAGGRWLIAGSGGDLGAALIKRFREAGAMVCAVSRSARRAGADVAVEADFTVLGEASRAAKAGERLLGRVDGVVWNAGGGTDRLVAVLEGEELSRLWQLQVVAPNEFLRALLPGMMARRSGVWIGISSLAAARPEKGQAGYGAVKAAFETWVKALAREVGPKGIRANALAPGFVESRRVASLPKPIQERLLRERILLGRWARPEEIAEAAVFLGSEAAGYMTGQVLRIDGGAGT
ncbi:MAG: 3-oxoacyl-[acyl-carrier-protein] reductase [Candidatus Methylacidiphilales bacterium]